MGHCKDCHGNKREVKYVQDATVPSTLRLFDPLCYNWLRPQKGFDRAPIAKGQGPACIQYSFQIQHSKKFHSKVVTI